MNQLSNTVRLSSGYQQFQEGPLRVSVCASPLWPHQQIGIPETDLDL